MASTVMSSNYAQLRQEDDPLGIKENIEYNPYLICRKLCRSNPQVDLSSEQFNSQEFLKVVHADSTFEELSAGLDNLCASMEEKTELLRNLVKQNFSVFVNAKNSVDLVYNDMKKKVFSYPELGTENIHRDIEGMGTKIDHSLL